MAETTRYARPTARLSGALKRQDWIAVTIELAAACAQRRAASDELPGLAEHAEFNLRVLDGIQARIDALTGLIENQLDGPAHGESGAQ